MNPNLIEAINALKEAAIKEGFDFPTADINVTDSETLAEFLKELQEFLE